MSKSFSTLNICFCVLIGLAASQCGQPPVTSDNDPAEARGREEAAIRALLRSALEASNRGEVAGIVRCYAEDGLYMPPEAPPVRGREQISHLIESFLGTHRPYVTYTTESIQVLGSEAIEQGRFVATLKGPVRTGVHSGNVVHTLTRGSDGSWLITREIWNVVLSSASADSRTENP